MSCVADTNAMASARPPTTSGAGWSATRASHSPRPQSSPWLTRIQPRFRPSIGIGNLSISGDHRNLKLHGAWASVNSPTTRMSKPSCFIHVGIAIHTRPSGRPDENDSRTTDSRRQLPVTALRLCQVLRRVGGAASGMTAELTTYNRMASP